MPIALHLPPVSSTHHLSSFYASTMIHRSEVSNIRVSLFSIKPLHCFEGKECSMGDRKDGPVKSRSKPESDWRTVVSTFRFGSRNCFLLLLMNRLLSVLPSGGVAVGSHGGCSFQSTPLPISAVEAINNRPLTPQLRTNADNPLTE